MAGLGGGGWALIALTCQVSAGASAARSSMRSLSATSGGRLLPRKGPSVIVRKIIWGEVRMFLFSRVVWGRVAYHVEEEGFFGNSFEENAQKI